MRIHRFDTDHECDRRTDGRTDRRTDRQTPRRWQRRAKHSAVARKNGSKKQKITCFAAVTIVAVVDRQ